ncbi:alpha beta-hydrolase [Lactarius sanguifluus]|nr:alpha beta-hydrolase [Lactarius sanguifluus]
MSNFTEAWIPGPKSSSFYTRTYTPASGSPRGVVVFIHGFIEHIARYEHVHKRWAEKGFVIFTFDQRGFGRTALDSKKSPDAVYGRTGDTDQIPDVAWALQVAQEANPTIPLFLMGHSMGGALVLSFATRANTQDSVSQLSGIIATSPCVRLAKPPAGVARWIGSRVRAILPNQNIPAAVEAKFLSHDPEVVKDNENDPLIRHSASLRAVDDMLNRVRMLLKVESALIRIHHVIIQVCSVEAAKQFIEKVPAEDKRIALYEVCLHWILVDITELQNEPDGVKEKFVDECVAWAEAHLSAAAGDATQAKL